ncbi:MAG: efflux RND transporter periplasmic adaptor subunit [Prochlorotrichaceae cyanobacterium]
MMPSFRQVVPLMLLLSLGSSGCALLQKIGGGGSSPGGFSPDQVQVFPVSLQTLAEEPVEDSSLFIGTLEAAERVVIKPETEGRIIEILVKPGDPVTPGKALLRLSPNRSEAALTAAQARVAAARAAKNTTEATRRSSQARVQELMADLALQTSEFARIDNLVKEGALAQQALDQVVRDRDAAEAALNAAKEQVLANAAAVEEAKAALAQAEAEVRSVQEDLADTTVNAPIAGVLGNLDVKQGDYVEVGDTLTTITNNQALEIELPVPVEYRERLKPNLVVELRDYSTETVLAEGQVDFVSPTVDNRTQSILVKAKVDNSEGTLQDAQQVEARILWSEAPGILVPTEAIVRFGGQTFIFVAKTEENALIAEQRPITLGNLQGNAYHVLEGLSAGEQIVVSGMLNLSDGATIMVQDEGAGKSQS